MLDAKLYQCELTLESIAALMLIKFDKYKKLINIKNYEILTENFKQIARNFYAAKRNSSVNLKNCYLQEIADLQEIENEISQIQPAPHGATIYTIFF